MAQLKIYNTLSRQKEVFTPIHPPKVGMYVCGMTVYDFCHVGNARVNVFFDVVARYLCALGFKLTYVRNITDIDDKIIKRAQELKEDHAAVSMRFTEALHEDMQKLGILSPSFEPKVTANIENIIADIKTLVEKGYAYSSANGDVYYDIKKFSAYGKLAHQNLEDLRAGTRVEINTDKHDPLDFVLWKKARPGEPAWDSPWSIGRPGWHMECSTMSQHYLGNHFDIHGGGADLQFPHHQNETAQAEALHGDGFVNYWMHVGFVTVNREKMSKSLGNFFSVREVLKLYHPEVLRYFLLASHYRSPLNYTEDNLDMAKAALTRLYTAIRGLEFEHELITTLDDAKWDSFKSITITDEHIAALWESFKVALDDDFNIPAALSHMFDLAHYLNKSRTNNEEKKAQEAAKILCNYMGNVLGILQSDPQKFLQGSGVQNDAENFASQVEELIKQRTEARQNRDFKAADAIRGKLSKLGVTLEDTPQGTVWKRGV